MGKKISVAIIGGGIADIALAIQEDYRPKLAKLNLPFRPLGYFLSYSSYFKANFAL